MKPVSEEESHFLDDTADIAPLFTDHRNKGLERFIEEKFSTLFSTKVSIDNRTPALHSPPGTADRR